MKKKGVQKEKRASQETNAVTTAIENQKYEVAQEMGINPKAKNKNS